MRRLRYVRIACATLVLLLVTGVFFGLSWGQPLVDAQFIPALLRSTGAGWTVAIVLLGALVLSTLIIGRWYCSFLCPFGILQDVISRIARIFKPKHKFKPQPKVTWLHYGVLALLLIPAFMGSAAGIALLDPYSLFGRFINSIFDPFIRELNNLGAWIVSKTGHYWIVPVKIHWPPLWSMILTSSILLLVTAAVIWNGRVFCNTLCPAGAILRFLARFSIFQLRITDTICNRCGSCERECKTGCIDRKAKTIDFSRCVLCFNCAEACHKDGIGFAINPIWKRKSSSGERTGESLPSSKTTPEALGEISGPISPEQSRPASVNRRLFLRSGVIATGLITGAAGYGQGRGQGKGRHGQGRHGDGVPYDHSGFNYWEPLHPTLPPGAVDLDEFQSHCTACQLCVNECPTHALVPGFLQLGILGFQQPVFDFSRAYCEYECNRCTQLCPTGALTPLDLAVKKTTRIGLAHFFKGHCVVHTEGNECGACIEHCPTMAVTGIAYRSDRPELLLPHVNPALCIGCGICQHACPVSPEAIRVEGLTEHETAETKKSKPLENVPDLSEGFPF